MAYCQMVEKPKAIPVLELLLRSKKYLFKANLMLAEIYEEAKQKVSSKHLYQKRLKITQKVTVLSILI